MDQDASTTPVNSTEEDNALQFIQKVGEGMERILYRLRKRVQVEVTPLPRFCQ